MIRNMETPPQILEILATCAEQHGVHVGSMTAKTREAPVVAARRTAVRILSEQGHSTPAIGRYLGGMHHSSVMHLLHTAGPARRLMKLSVPKIRVGMALREDLLARLAEVAAHRAVLNAKLAALDDMESMIGRMLKMLKKPLEDVA